MREFLLISCPSLQANEVISKLYAAHQEGQKNAGFDIEADGAAVKDVAKAGIVDLYNAKWWGIKLATNAATTVLRVDQVRLLAFTAPLAIHLKAALPAS